nr:hypothetical protein [Tanacetum cinerariifolium]
MSNPIDDDSSVEEVPTPKKKLSTRRLKMMTMCIVTFHEPLQKKLHYAKLGFVHMKIVVNHLDGIWKKYTRLGRIWRRNGRDYNSTPKSKKKKHTDSRDGVTNYSDDVRSP